MKVVKESRVQAGEKVNSGEKDERDGLVIVPRHQFILNMKVCY